MNLPGKPKAIRETIDEVRLSDATHHPGHRHISASSMLSNWSPLLRHNLIYAYCSHHKFYLEHIIASSQLTLTAQLHKPGGDH